MSLFSKTEIKPEMESFIAKGEGVGIVKVDDYGKASARIESHKIILESYDDEYPIIESIASINYLSYDPGNFFQEPKLEIGLGQKKYILAGVDNNDDELEAFYNSVLSIKKHEKKQLNNTQKNQAPKIQNNVNENYDEIDELEEELSNKQSTKNTKNKIKGFLSKRFDDSQENEELTQPEEDSNNTNDLNKKTEKNNDLESVLYEEEFLEDDDEEILLLEEEPEEKREEKSKEILQKQEIKGINDYDELDEFDEIDDFEEIDSFEVDEEIILEDDIEEESIILEDDIEEESMEKTVENVNQPKSENITPQNEEPVKTVVEKTQKIPTKDNIAPEINLNKEITQAKQELDESINNIDQEITKTQNTQSNNTFDPVYQIRRYYELKKEGIITEEEFEQKKKQLLEL